MRRPLKAVVRVLALQIISLVALLALAGIALLSIGPGDRWTTVARPFRGELAIVRVLLYSVLGIAWADTYRRCDAPDRRHAVLQLGLATLACILLVELQGA